MKNFIKILSLVAAVVVTGFLALNFESKERFVKVSAMEEATLPVVYMLDGDTRYNELHGFTAEVDRYGVSKYLTVLPMDRKLSISIDKYNAGVKQVAYEIRSKDGTNLYEDTVVKEYDDTDGVITATLNIKNLLDVSEEYILIVKLRTANFDKVCYYTVLRFDEEAKVTKKISLCREFSDNTFDRDNLSNIKKYIESSDEGDNTNYGYINIHSSLNMFGYGNLDITRETEPRAYLIDVSGYDAIIYLKFRVSVLSENERTYYDVVEKYTMSESKTGMYLMDYERTMNQDFVMKGSVKNSSRIYLGITDARDINYFSDEKERFTVFVRNGELLMYDIKKNVLTSIFTFADNETDLIRERYGEHDVNIIDVDTAGNVVFAVYGYMNRGLHEGMLGASICTFDYKTSEIKEIRFVPVTCSFDTLREHFGEISHVDENKTITIMIDNTLYAFDTLSHENTVVVDRIEDGNYSISTDGKNLAYIRDNEIRIYSLAEQKQHIITTPEGEQIKNIGYIDNDFVYGYAKNADIVYGSDGNDMFPMYKVIIIDENYKTIKEYGIDGAYVVDYEIIGNRVNFIRVKYEGDHLVYTDIDQLINKNDNQAARNSQIKRTATESRLYELYLGLTKAVPSAKSVEYGIAAKVTYEENVLRSPMAIAYEDSRRALNKAHMLYKCNTTKKALSGITGDAFAGETSFETCARLLLVGLGKPEDIVSELGRDKDILDVINECPGITAINLTGHTLSEVLGFTTMNSPVIAKTGTDEYCIIVGYTRSNVLVYVPGHSEIESYDKAEFESRVNKMRDVYISYYR